MREQRMVIHAHGGLQHAHYVYVDDQGQAEEHAHQPTDGPRVHA